METDTQEKVQTNEIGFSVEKNSFSDAGDGVVKFNKGQTIIDGTEMWNGARYDIASMDISGYKNLLTADHSMSIREIIGEVSGVKKGRNRVSIDSIRFAIKENALAKFAYDMMLGGFLKDFSIESTGPWPDDDGVYKESKLVGLSAVVVGNNKSATINTPAFQEFAMNSIKQSKEQGLDTELVEKVYLKHNFNPSQNHMSDEPQVPGQPVETPAPAPVATATPATPEPVKTENSVDTIMKAVQEAIAPISAKLAEMEQNALDKSAVEPSFQPAKGGISVATMSWRERHGRQITAAWDLLKRHDNSALNVLNEVNKVNLEELQKAGKVSNSMTIADFGNFVISPELLTEIEGFRSDFSGLISRLNFRETLSLQMSWLKRDGDVNMQEVENCDDGADGNLKPISEYEAEIQTSNLHELAAVTPVCNAATRFLAADMLGDIAQGYRTDFDRKRAQLFIARAQQAINSTGNTKVYTTTSDVNALKSVIDLWGFMQEEIMGGVFIFNHKTYSQLMSRAVGAGISGPLAGLLLTGDMRNFMGSPFIVVPNELMPTLNSNETKSFVVEGVTVTINQAVLYVDLNTFSGRTSGGLSYDLSTDAAYEVSGTVKSAFQRNELVLRGSFFRGGAIRDEDKVVGMGTAGIS
jgi:HK97 family phage major capsid protein